MIMGYWGWIIFIDILCIVFKDKEKRNRGFRNYCFCIVNTCLKTLVRCAVELKPVVRAISLMDFFACIRS